MEMNVVRVLRHDDEIEINKMHEQHPTRGEAKDEAVPLHVTAHCHPKRKYKVTDYDQETNVTPSAFSATHKPADLLWNIGVPNEEILTKGDVRPKDDKPKHELTRIVKVPNRERIREDLVTREPQGAQDERREDGDHGPREDIDTEHGAEPVRVKAHQPIEGEEGEGEREGEHRDRRELTHLEGER
jgi:hypothetical protein